MPFIDTLALVPTGFVWFLVFTIKKAVGWSTEQTHITFTFQHGIQNFHSTQTTEKAHKT